MPQLNPTQMAGLFGFGMAALVAGLAGRRRAWRLIAIANGLFMAEVLLKLRHRLSIGVGHLLGSHYGERRGPQEMLVLLLGTIGLVTLLSVTRHIRGGALRVGALATLAALLLFLVEAVSLHQIDHLLYRSAGPILSIGWIWLALGLVTAGAAAAAPGRRHRSKA